MRGRKRHLLVDTEGLVLKAKVHSAKVLDQEGIERPLDGAKEVFPRLSHLWLDAAYTGVKREAEVGWRRSWGGVWTSLNVCANLLQKEF